MAAAGQIFRFGRFELDAGRRRLARDGENLFVPDRQLDTLIVLVKNAGHFVSKHTIVETKPRYGYRFVMPVEDARRKNLSSDSKECCLQTS